MSRRFLSPSVRMLTFPLRSPAVIQNFLYSKIMLWVAVDRGLRLADKRSLPLPQRAKWLEVRDTIYEEVQNKGWNKE